MIFTMRAGAGSDDRHRAHQHVDELGKLIDVGFANEFADAQEARIVVDEELRPVGLVLRGEALLDLVGVAAHGAEFEAVE